MRAGQENTGGPAPGTAPGGGTGPGPGSIPEGRPPGAGITGQGEDRGRASPVPLTAELAGAAGDGWTGASQGCYFVTTG